VQGSRVRLGGIPSIGVPSSLVGCLDMVGSRIDSRAGLSMMCDVCGLG